MSTEWMVSREPTVSSHGTTPYEAANVSYSDTSLDHEIGYNPCYFTEVCTCPVFLL